MGSTVISYISFSEDRGVPTKMLCTTNPLLHLNSDSFVRPRRGPTEVGTEVYTTRPEIDCRQRSEKKRVL